VVNKLIEKLHQWVPDMRFQPRSLELRSGYTRKRFVHDLGAGFTVAVVALPLAMAFAIASGAKPEAGIFTAIIAGFLISVLGGSRVQIGGPAGAFIVVLYGILERYGWANLLIATSMAGVLLFAMGFFRIGNMIKYIPVGIIIGFTNGIAVLIALSQVKDFLGLEIERMPGDFFHQISVLYQARHSLNWYAFAVAAGSLLMLIFWPKGAPAASASGDTALTVRMRRTALALPAPLIVLVAATLATTFLHLPLATIGSKFGGIPQALPSFALPDFNWELAKHLLIPTVTIALLGAIESLLCARVADALINDRHDPNQELMAQGVANFVVPFFGGIAATGTIARTVTSVRAGANSPVAGVVHATVLLMIVLLAAPLAEGVPLAGLSAILMFVAWNMGDWREFGRLGQFTPYYRIVLVSTFLLTVILDVTVAVEVGLLLACGFFILRVSQLTTVERVAREELPEGTDPRIEVYDIFGSLFFGAVAKVEALSDVAGASGERMMLVLDVKHMINLDTTGLDGLSAVLRDLHKRGDDMVICGAHPQPNSLMHRAGFLELMGAENLQPDLKSGLERARVLLALADTHAEAPNPISPVAPHDHSH
jgi:SulP family sulfate permease